MVEEARRKAMEAGSVLGALRRKGAPIEEIEVAERALADAQFELRVQNAIREYLPTPELMNRVFQRLQDSVAVA